MNIKITLRAQRQINSAYWYIRSDSLQYSDEFLAAIYALIHKIGKYPTIGMPYIKNVRKRFFKKYHYNIYYRVKKNSITILGIWYVKRGSKFKIY
ncbi:MAG: type II toxin-antitoxin system RelE/ParE family toxin [Candidatus Fibromonas sp.]|jgi:plasmid stabilization system protein ParE|nr:type II toxin-antitoxin system RelE/ParE family toxin [Candidatus Fibromonas sp.]